MAKVQNNSIIFTQEEAEELNSKLDKITTVVELIELMKEYYALADITLELNWNPSFKYHERYNGVIPCFKGPISGKNIDISGKPRQEVYSLSCNAEQRRPFHNIFRIETGSGGGGGNWHYDYGYIDIRHFPAMLTKYGFEISEADIKQHQHTHQITFDEAIKELDIKLSSIENTVKYTKKSADTYKYIRQLEDTISRLKTQLSDYTANEVAKQASADKLVLPTTTSIFVDLTKYNRLVSKLKTDPFAEVKLEETIHDSQKNYELFIAKHPEYFI